MQTESFRGRAVVAQEVIVRFRAQDSTQRRLKAASVSAQDADIESSEPVGNSGTVRIRSHGRNVAALIQAYAARSDVEYAEPNYIWHTSDFPNDLSLGQQWALSNTGQTIDGQVGIPGADIKAASAWAITPGSRSIVVGVLDSGIDKIHPDLIDNVWIFPTAFSFTVSGKTTSCPAGTRGYSAFNGCLPSPADSHGTHVAGIIGATGNNGFGVTGVSPMVQIMDLQFLDQNGEGTTSDVIKVIDFAIQAKAFFGPAADLRVLNASWGGFTFSQALLDEINLAGANNILFVAAAGNESQNIDSTPEYPAAFNAANIITVAATDNRDNLASFSNFGVSNVDIGAPGVDIYSTVPSQSFESLSGTSMAAPMVSGAAALVLSACPNLNVAQLKAALLSPSSVDLVPSLAGKVATGGRLNVFKAMQTCGAVTPSSDFRLVGAVGFPVVTPGATMIASVSLSSIGSFSDNVNLTLKIPSGFTASLASTVLSPGAPTTTIAIIPSAGVVSGNYLIGVTGTANGVTRTTGVEVVVTALSSLNFSSELNANFYRHPVISNTYLAFFGFAVSGRSVTMDVKSTAFDTIMTILDANGSLVASNHGGGGGFNSRISMFLPAGTYLLQVSNAVPNQLGAFSVNSDLVFLSSISPTIVRQNSNSSIRFTGTGFTPGMTAFTGAGITPTASSFVNPTTYQVNVSVAADAPLGSRSIWLMDGLGGTSPATLTVLPATPEIYTVTPSSGLAATDVDVVISGNFFVTPLNVYGYYRGVNFPVTNVVVDNFTTVRARLKLPMTTYSEIVSPAYVNLVVETPSGVGSFITFVLIPPPPIINFISGTNFHQGTSSQFGMSVSNFFLPYTVNAGSDVTFNVTGNEGGFSGRINVGAAAALGPRSLTVTTAGGTIAITINILPPLPPPTLISVSPNFGNAGKQVAVTFTGTNFGGDIVLNAGTGIGGNATASDPSNGSGTIVIPSNASWGVRNLTVTTPWGTSAAIPFTVLPQLPIVDSLSSKYVAPGNKNVGLSFYGKNFTSPIAVTSSPEGISFRSFQIVDSTILFVRMDVDAAAVPGPRSLVVWNNGGSADPITFSVALPPVLTSSVPSIGKQGKSFDVTFNGTGFLPGMTFSGDNGISFIVKSISDQAVTAAMFIGSSVAIGTHTITGTSEVGPTNPISFEVVSALPVVQSISPSVLLRGTSQTVTLGGTNFLSPLTINAGADISISNVVITSPATATAVLTVAPAAQLGNRGITISTPDGTSAATSLSVITPAPTLISINPAGGEQNSSILVSLSGTNLVLGLTIDAGPDVAVTNIAISNFQPATATLSIAPNAVLGPRTLSVSTSGGVSNVLTFTIEPQTLRVSKAGIGTGTVTSSPPGIDCGPTCRSPFSNGQVFVLTPTPAPGSVFAGWSGDSDCTDGQVTMTAPKSCVARFDLPQANSTLLRGDYDGDGKTDIAVYRPSTGEWFLRLSTQGYVVTAGNWYFQWGVPGDVPLSGDFDGDGKSDISVYRPSTGEWFIRNSTQNYVIAAGNWYFQWGAPGDVPITGDFDGDGKTDIAVYRAATGEWFIRHSSLNYAIAAGNWLFQWGVPGDQPLASDFDGDGRTDIAVFRPATGEWFIRLSSQNYAIASGPWYYLFGNSAFQPVPGDYDGDRKTDLAVYRPETGEWFLRLSTLNYDVISGNMLFQWGIPGDLPLKGDFDGDGKADIAVYRPSTGEWFLRLSTQGYAIAQGNWYFQWGVPGDLPFRR